MNDALNKLRPMFRGRRRHVLMGKKDQSAATMIGSV